MSRTTKKIYIKDYDENFILPESIAKKQLKKLGRIFKLQPWNRKQNKKLC